MGVLGLEWTLLKEAACCGSRECGGLSVENELLALANNARTLAMAEAAGAGTIVNVCSTCHLELEGSNQRLQQDPGLLQQVNAVLEVIHMHYNGTVRVEHLLHVIVDEVGLDRVAALVKRPLTGLRIAPFYGCHLLRPAKLHRHRDDPYNPRSLGRLIESLGGTEVHYSGKSKCCGFHSLVVNSSLPLQMSGQHLIEAKGQGADLVVTPCPLCHTVLDSYQPRVERERKEKIGLPILHLPQMVGLALGLSFDELGLDRHMVSARGTLVAYLQPTDPAFLHH
jgi:succinate dehydrogenase / fumarate reductase cytochrome b subunit